MGKSASQQKKHHFNLIFFKVKVVLIDTKSIGYDK